MNVPYAALVTASERVAATSKRTEKVSVLAALLRTVPAEAVPIVVGLLLGRVRQGRLGVGWSTVAAVDRSAAGAESSVTELGGPVPSAAGAESSVTKPGVVDAGTAGAESSVTEPFGGIGAGQGASGVSSPTVHEGLEPDDGGAPQAVSSLTVHQVDRAMTELAGTAGPGSQAERGRILHELFARATPAEDRHLRQVLRGEMRQGANEGVLADAVARASGRSPAAVRRAAMLLGDLGEAARRALDGDPLEGIGLQVLVAVQPMLASTAARVDEAVAEIGPSSVEAKLDGARIQVHRHGDDIRVFTRSLRDITAGVPEIVAEVSRFGADDVVLDGEALGLDDEGRPLAFQDSMSGESRLRPFFFDLLHVDGTSTIDRPLAERKAALAEVVPPSMRLASIDTDDGAAAEAFAAEVLAMGHEGVMVKALHSPYEAGRRGASWRKVKPVHTLDLIVLAVEWGSGRRQGWLSNLHLGAADGHGGFLMVGKTFKGMTDEMLRWQTERLQQLAIGTDGYVVHVRPELVAEIALDGAQHSRRYPGGVALRFARVRRYRTDKSPAEVDHIDRVRRLLPPR